MARAVARRGVVRVVRSSSSNLQPAQALLARARADDDVRVAEIPRGQPGSARCLQSNVTIQLSSSMDPSVQTELRLPCQVVLAPKPMT
eukprot:COSAG01_NODE_49300_length_373_cov_0.948905_1_plen_87_part_10